MFLKNMPHILSSLRIILSSYSTYAFFQCHYTTMAIVFIANSIMSHIKIGASDDTHAVGKYLHSTSHIVSRFMSVVTVYYIHPTWILSFIPQGLNKLLKTFSQNKEMTSTRVDGFFKFMNHSIFPSSLYLSLVFPQIETLLKPIFGMTIALGSFSTWQVWKNFSSKPLEEKEAF